MQIVKYETQEEYDAIVADKQAQGLILTHVSNVTEGNFLGFKEPSEIPEPVEDQITTLGQQLVAKDLEILQLEADNQTLGQQVVALDLRLMALEGGAGA